MDAERTDEGPAPVRRFEHGALTEQVIGLAFDVHHELGGGFLEALYREAFAISLSQAKLDFQREAPVAVHFRGIRIGTFRLDFLIADAVIVEAKAKPAIGDADRAQLLNYLRATEFEVGLLINFGSKLTFQRFAYQNARKFSLRPPA